MRYELADCEWDAIKPMLPNKPRGIPRVNDRRVLNGIFWVLRSGALGAIYRKRRSDPNLLQPLSLPCPQPGRAFLQSDQAMSSGGDALRKVAANYLAFVQVASIRLWLRVNESAP
jgi:transposase